MTTIGTYCIFSSSACNTCPFGYVSPQNSCECVSGNLKNIYRFSDMNTISSFIVFDRNTAYDLIFGNSREFDLTRINQNIPPQVNPIDFFNNECWPGSAANIVMIKAYFCCYNGTAQAYVYGFYNYSISNNTLTLTPRTRSEPGLCPGDQCYLATKIDHTTKRINLSGIQVSPDKTRITWDSNVYL